MAFQQITNPKITPGADGRAWVGQVTLSSGTATIDYAADLPGGSSIDGEPVVIATAKAAPDEAGVSSAGAAQAVIDDGSGASSNTVNVLIVEQ